MRMERYGALSAKIYRWLIDPLLLRLRPKIARLGTKYGIRTVLDIGTATGAQCRILHAVGIRAVGLDLSEAMVAAAKAQSPKDIEYVVGSAYGLPFADASFHSVLLSLALHEHREEDRTKMLTEALRVVEPDGYLILAEYSEPARTRFHIPWLVIRLIEELAGTEHRAGFHQFMGTNGMDGFLQRHGLSPMETVHSHFHTLAIAIVSATQNLKSSVSMDVAYDHPTQTSSARKQRGDR